MTTTQRLSLGLRVLMEVGVVLALGYWGFHTGHGTGPKLLLGIGAPLLGFGFWGAVDFHSRRHAEVMRLIQELAISGLAALACYATGQRALGIALGALSVGYHLFVYASGETLLEPGHDPLERSGGRIRQAG